MMREMDMKDQIKEEAKNISKENIQHSEWVDKDTWVCWGITWTSKLENLKYLLNEVFGLSENEETIITIEYHADEKKFVYGLVVGDETLTITDMIASEELENSIRLYQNEKIKNKF